MSNIVYGSVCGVAVDKAQRCAQPEKQSILHICRSYVMLLVSENVHKIRPTYEPRYVMPYVGNITEEKPCVRLNFTPAHKFRSMFQILRTSWSWALLEKPPVVQLLKKFPALYGTRRFIIVFTRALHWSLHWARLIQPIQPNPISFKIHFNIVTCRPISR
jgi:hypothetical protein